MSLNDAVVAMVRSVQELPYRWPSAPTAESARSEGSGSCASKHALLAQQLIAMGVPSRPLLCIGPLVPSALADRFDLGQGADLLEVHELLTVDVPRVGPCRVDVTWDPPLIRGGLPGTLDWRGDSDMTPAVGLVHDWYAPDPGHLRLAKESLRRRLYQGDQRARRDRTLAAMSSAFAALRDEGSPSSPSRAPKGAT
ncbi:MAG TPA: hypothetical protein VFZ83_06295 [Acidimicrobiia bacterium]|nr:hypothetical protein [Acidimicrobiia bacterium]